MANPQIEQGHTRVANEILEKIMQTNLNGTQFRIVMAIWRYTYGFRRKEHELSISFLAKAINASRSQIDRELAILIERKIISIIKVGSRGARVMSFNKNYEEWSDRSPSGVQSPPSINKPEKKDVKKKPPTKKEDYDDNNTYLKMAKYFHTRVVKVAKEANVEHLIKKANLQKWADEFRKLIEIDKVDKRLAKDVMDWVTQDSFWRTNVLSAKKLREKFSDLAIKMNSAKTPKKQLEQPDIREREVALQNWIQEGKDPNEFDWRK